jgi:hypothetical protein
VTDAGLAHLVGLTSLRELNLWNTEVTDAGLAHLAGLKSLQELSLWGTRVTNAGVARLKKRLPDCNILALTDRRRGQRVRLAAAGWGGEGWPWRASRYCPPSDNAIGLSSCPT